MRSTPSSARNASTLSCSTARTSETPTASTTPPKPSCPSIHPSTEPQPIGDAFSDSLWGGIGFLEAPRVAIIWTDCHQMLTGGLPDFLIIASILEDLARDAKRVEPRIRLLSFLVGDGPNFEMFEPQPQPG